MLNNPRKVPFLFALVALLAASCAQLDALPRLDAADLKHRLAQSSRIFASDGRLITTLHGEENRTIIRSLRKIPQHVLDAVIAIEDERFFEHGGVDMRAILRAAVANVSSGDIREGGSTITQQYVKNVIIAPGETADRTFERKINEAALARQLEKILSKNEILRRYLNTVYFGQGAYGIQAAAKTYFDRPATRLTLGQGALLAGLIRSPSTYNPFQDKQAALQRRDVVLNKMEQLGMFDAGRVAQAKAAKLRINRGAVTEQRYPAPYFVDYVQRLLTHDPRFEAIGKTVAQRTKSLFQGGLRIHTTVDLDAQAAAERAVDRYLTEPNDPHASLVAVDPNTGHVKAMVGGRDWFARRKVDRFAKLNLAIQAEPGLGPRSEAGQAAGTGRQAGSAFKPFALAAAVRAGTPLAKTYKAQPCMNFPAALAGDDWRVCNYESTDFGSKLSLLEATVKSVNVVYAQLILEIGAEATVDLADKMGINTPLAPVPSSALGTNAVNPLGMASAFGTFATNGVHHPPVAITKIVNPRGKVLYKAEDNPERVLDPASAFITTSALQQVIQRGTGVRANIGRPAAGKTGTAQEWRDAWFAGYTPNLAAAVWVGYPQGEIEMKTSCPTTTLLAIGEPSCIPTRIQVSGGTWPAEIWGAFMREALAGTPARDFSTPDIDLVTVTIDARCGLLADKLTPKEDRTEALLPKDAVPKKTCRVGAEKVKVPDVFGFPVADATRILEDEGFAMTVSREKTREFPPGRVISQDPSGGSKARIGSTIALVVSSRGSPKPDDTEEHEESATVPDVLGMRWEDAEARLKEEGYEVDVIFKRESDRSQAARRRGRVWKQSPAGGSEAEPGSRVKIWVNPR